MKEKWKSVVFHNKEEKYPYFSYIQYGNKKLYDKMGEYINFKTAFSEGRDYACCANGNQNTPEELRAISDPQGIEVYS